MRSLPNIIITGTPGVGKTTTVMELISLASSSSPEEQGQAPIKLKHLSINDLVKLRNCHGGFSDEHQSYIVDDDKLMDEVEKEIEDGAGQGGWVIDWHSTEGFAIRWIDLVVVLRCEDTAVLYDRLAARGYADEKVQENLDAEIFGTVWDEAMEGWGGDDAGDGDEVGRDGSLGAVVQLKSETAEQVEENAERILEWVRKWMQDQKEKV